MRLKPTVVLVDSSIGALSRSLGTSCFGTQLRRKDGGPIPIDLATNADGARVIRARNLDQLRDALVGAKAVGKTVVMHTPVDPSVGVPGYESWWDVPVAEVSETASVQEARRAYEESLRERRWHVGP